jgi:hypothetical protein
LLLGTLVFTLLQPKRRYRPRSPAAAWTPPRSHQD